MTTRYRYYGSTIRRKEETTTRHVAHREREVRRIRDCITTATNNSWLVLDKGLHRQTVRVSGAWKSLGRKILFRPTTTLDSSMPSWSLLTLDLVGRSSQMLDDDDLCEHRTYCMYTQLVVAGAHKRYSHVHTYRQGACVHVSVLYPLARRLASCRNPLSAPPVLFELLEYVDLD